MPSSNIVAALETARNYRDRGWCPVPVRYRSKAGAPGWRNFEPSDDELNRCFGNGPTNIGVLLGERSGDLVDVDLDCPSARSLAPSFLPETDCVFGRESARGSHHIYRCSPAPKTAMFLDPSGGKGTLVELRSTGHQTVFPPSIHPSGERIEFERGGEPARVAPDYLVNQLEKLAAAAAIASHWNPGIRHEISLALSGLLLRGGWNVSAVTEFITRIARVAGDDEWSERSRDVDTTARRLADNGTVKGGPSLAKVIPESVARKAAEWLGVNSPAPRNEAGVAGPVVTCASEVVPERIKWLWDGRIARGKITVLDGDPGLGKTTLALDVASRKSSGRPMPGSEEACEPGGTLIISCEDGVADTVVPRLQAAEADLQRIKILSVIRDADGAERLPVIPADLPVIRDVIAEMRAKLVIIDPLMAYLGDRVNSWSDQSIRRALSPLANLAQESGAAILVVRHLRKSDDGPAIYRGGGSIGIIGQARTGLLVAEDPGNSDNRILAVTKCNVAAKAPSLRFRFSTPGPDQPTLLAPKIDWLGEVQLSADELVHAAPGRRRHGPSDEATEFLKEVLSDRPMPANWIKKEAKERGIASATLERAKRALGVKSKRREWLKNKGTELGKSTSPGDRWFWWIEPSDISSD